MLYRKGQQFAKEVDKKHNLIAITRGRRSDLYIVKEERAITKTG